MPLKQHGTYSLHWQGQVLVQASAGTWNEECSRNLQRDALALLARRARDGQSGHWAMLCDCTTWEGVTPEGSEAWWDFFQDCARHGLAAMADVMPSRIHGLMLDEVTQRCAALLPHQRCASMAEAWAWLRAQGFEGSDAGTA